MLWEIWTICVIVFGACAIITGNIRAQNGPTKKETIKMEKKYNRALTEADLTDYKNSITFVTIACVVAMTLLFISMLI